MVHKRLNYQNLHQLALDFMEDRYPDFKIYPEAKPDKEMKEVDFLMTFLEFLQRKGYR